MRRPAKESDPLVVLHGLFGLRQHARLRAFDQFETFELVLGVFDHRGDDAVAIVTGFDAVELGIELVLVSHHVGDVLDACVGHILRHDDAVTGALEIDGELLDRLVVEIGFHVGGHRRHPVAQECIDVLVLHRSISDGHRQCLDFRLIAQRIEHDRGDAGDHLNVGPADIGEAHRLATFGICGECRCGEAGSQQERRRHQVCLRLHMFSPSVLCRSVRLHGASPGDAADYSLSSSHRQDSEFRTAIPHSSGEKQRYGDMRTIYPCGGIHSKTCSATWEARP